MGSYKEHLDPVDHYNPFFPDDLDASSSGVGLNLSEELGILLLFLCERQRVMLKAASLT